MSTKVANDGRNSANDASDGRRHWSENAPVSELRMRKEKKVMGFTHSLGFIILVLVVMSVAVCFYVMKN